MKKKLLYVSAVAFLATGMVSCIDNDEPSSLKELRQAKANEINANAKVKNMQAFNDSLKAINQDLLNKAQELVNAKTAYMDALEMKKAESDNALAMKKAESDNALAMKKAESDNAIAMEKNAADLKTYLATAEKELAAAQQALEETKLKAQASINKLKADLEASTYTSLTTIFNAKNTWYSTYVDTKTVEALTSVSNAEKDLVDKKTALLKAEQDLLVAVNTCEKDSLTNRNTLADAVADAEYDVFAAGLSVELAEKNLADFDAIDKDNAEAWGKKYADLQKEIDELQKQIDNYDEKIKIAKNDQAVAEAALETQKELLGDSLTNYNDKKSFYAFKLDEKIAEEWEGAEFDNGETGDDRVVYFSEKGGVLANENPIKNSDLGDALQSILDEIDANYYIIDDATIETGKQYLDEYKAQMASFEKTYKDDKTAFDAAAKAYRAAATAYEYSELDDYSTLYERTYAAIETYQNLTDRTGKHSALATAISEYLKKRFAFDGFESTASIDYYDENSDLQTLKLKDLRENATITGDKKIEAFESLITTNAMNDLIGGNERIYGSTTDGCYYAYRTTANKLFGFDDTDSRFVELSQAELDAINDDDTDDLTNYGSQGLYENAKRKVEEIQEDIDMVKTWQALYDEIEAVKDANQNKLDAYASAEHKSYNSLQKYVDAVAAAKKVVTDLTKEQGLISDEIGYKEGLQTAILPLTDFADDDIEDMTAEELAEAYDICVKYIREGLLYDITTAKQAVTDAEIALEKANKDLADYDNGEYDYSDAIQNAKDAVEKAQMDLTLAENTLAAKKAYLAEVLEALKD